MDRSRLFGSGLCFHVMLGGGVLSEAGAAEMFGFDSEAWEIVKTAYSATWQFKLSFVLYSCSFWWHCSLAMPVGWGEIRRD